MLLMLLGGNIHLTIILCPIPDGACVPEMGYVRCNLNAVFLGLANITSWGFCSETRMELLCWLSDWDQPCLPTSEGKALGLLIALKWLMDCGLAHVEFESDCEVLVTSTIQDFSAVGAIIRQCKYIKNTIMNEIP